MLLGYFEVVLHRMHNIAMYNKHADNTTTLKITLANINTDFSKLLIISHLTFKLYKLKQDTLYTGLDIQPCYI